jgi:hypothetical protein
MSQHTTAHPTDAPVRYGSRCPSEPPAARSEPRCLVCMTSLPSRRARYCSDACKQRAYRLRRIDVTATDAALLATELKRLGELVAHTIVTTHLRPPVPGSRDSGAGSVNLLARCPTKNWSV